MVMQRGLVLPHMLHYVVFNGVQVQLYLLLVYFHCLLI